VCAVRLLFIFCEDSFKLRKAHDTAQVYQFYFHNDRGLNSAMLIRAKHAGINVMMLTVDSITGGNRERDLRTGFSIPFKLASSICFRPIE
jgi:L-lactate dehydrogenase (cytochrome)